MSTVFVILVLLLVFVALAVLGALELWLHRRRLAQIPIRVHVNGTRGKSSVTRLIAAGLRESGKTCCAKTTGTLPRMILPDGSELPVYRKSKANIIEQIRIVNLANELGAEALVIECMALQPEFQWLSEDKLVRATHGVITNARPDHLDVMGPDAMGVARALAGMIPPRQILYTAEQEPPQLNIIRECCQDRSAKLVTVDSDESRLVTKDELDAFFYREHDENVALALKVCTELGVDRATALRGMQKAKPDFGALTELQVDFFGRRIVFANGFAANDPVSSERIWRMVLDNHPNAQRRIIVLNSRADRPDRSLQLAEAFVHWPQADHLVIIGTGTFLFARAVVAAGWDASKLSFAEGLSVDQIFETIVEKSAAYTLVMGLGNIGGPGVELVRYFQNRSTLPATTGAAA